MEMEFKATTILGTVHNGVAALGGDGQVTLGNTVVKRNASKIRKLADGKITQVEFAFSVDLQAVLQTPLH